MLNVGPEDVGYDAKQRASVAYPRGPLLPWWIPYVAVLFVFIIAAEVVALT